MDKKNLINELKKRTYKTYKLSEFNIGRLTALAAHYQLGKSELVNILIHYALDCVQAGKLRLPIRTIETRRVDWDAYEARYGLTLSDVAEDATTNRSK